MEILKILYLFFLVFVISCNESSSPKTVVNTSELIPVAQTSVPRAYRQSIYVPIYTSMHYQGGLFDLTTRLSIRNISLSAAIIIAEVTSYDNNGQLLQRLNPHPFLLEKQSSQDFITPTGRSSSHFIVKWESDNPSPMPIIEAVMIGSQGTKGFSFISRGKEIESL